MANAIDNGCADGLSAQEMCSGDCVAVRHASPPPSSYLAPTLARVHRSTRSARSLSTPSSSSHMRTPQRSSSGTWTSNPAGAGRRCVRGRILICFESIGHVESLSVESQRENFSPHLGRHSTPSLLHTYYLVRVPPKPATLTAPPTSVLSDTRRRPSSLWPPPTWHPSSRAEETTSWCVGSSVD